MTAIRDRAVEALTRIITANQDPDTYPRATALECVAAMEGLGYRPTEARPPASWNRQHGGGAPASDEFRAIKAAIAAKPPLPEHRNDGAA